MTLTDINVILKGGRGSGDWGHVGRAGRRGGSGGGGGKGKPRRGRRSREVLNKEIEVGKKPKDRDSVRWGVNKGILINVRMNKSGKEIGDIKTADGRNIGGIELSELEKVSAIVIPEQYRGSSKKVDVKITQKSGGRENDKKSYPMYHATEPKFVDSILNEGIRATKENTSAGIPRGVYFSTSTKTAENYGIGAAWEADKFAVIEFEIPDNERRKIHSDEYDKKIYDVPDAFYYDGSNIPPEWIKKIHMYDETGFGDLGFERVQTILKQNDKSYSVVGIMVPSDGD